MSFQFRSWLGLALGLACAVLAGCSPHSLGDGVGGDGTGSLFESLRNADLSAKQPRRLRQPSGDMTDGSAGRYEFYPAEKPDAESRGRLPPGRSIATRQTSRGEGYELNFENANLSDVVKVVLGDTLKLPYIYDSRIQGQVTLSTGRAVTRAELLTILEAVLRMNNAVLVNGNAGYRVIPYGEAAAGEATAIEKGGPGYQPKAGYGVTALPLLHVSAESIMKLLEGFISRAGSIRAETNRNILIIRGLARDRQALVDVALSFDVDWLKGQSAAIYPLTNSTPEEMITELEKITQSGEGGISKGSIRLQPIERLNAVLALAKKPSQLRDIAAWIKRLDRTNPLGKNTFVYKVEHGKAVDLANILNETFGSGPVGQKRTGSQIAPGNRSTTTMSRGTGGATTTTGQRSLSSGGSIFGNRSASDQGADTGSGTAAGRTSSGATTSSTGATAFSTGGQRPIEEIRVVADEVNNSLLIHATAARYQKVLAILRQIDKPPLQVMINATIAEVTLNDTLRYGVQAFLRSSTVGLGKDKGGGGFFGGPDFVLQPSFPGFNFFLGSKLDPTLMLDALSRMTTVRVVSSPSVVVVDNQSATLQVGDEVPISTQQAQSITNPEAPLVNTIQFRDTGVILKVTPRVNSNGQVTMEVEQEISNVVGGEGASASLTPTISQRKIASTISVVSGQTVVLGGLISESRDKLKNRVPIFERVPVVGDLVGRTENVGKRTELIVFIRPQVIRDPYDASRVAEELRAKLKSFEPEIEPVRQRPWRSQAKPGK